MNAHPAPGADIGRAIRRRRQVLGWEQQELADRVGVHVNSVQKWEAGTHYPRRKLGKLEEVLGISLSDKPEPPPRRLSEHTKQMMREELGDELAAQLIAHQEHLVSGRTSSGQDDRPPGSARTGRRPA